MTGTRQESESGDFAATTAGAIIWPRDMGMCQQATPTIFFQIHRSSQRFFAPQLTRCHQGRHFFQGPSGESSHYSQDWAEQPLYEPSSGPFRLRLSPQQVFGFSQNTVLRRIIGRYMKKGETVRAPVPGPSGDRRIDVAFLQGIALL